MTTIAAGASATQGFAFRLRRGQDLRAALVAHVAELNIQAGAVVSCVGSLQVAHMRLADESLPAPMLGPFEIVSVTGTVGRGGCHLHMSVADATGRVLGGHMREGCLIHTTAEVVLVALVDLVFDRALDSETGFKELLIARA